MAKLIECPRELVRSRNGSGLRAAPELYIALEVLHGVIVHEYGGDGGGYLVANSLYRPEGTTCETDEGGLIDLTDANGHWTGRAVDYSARLTTWSFWGENCPKWRRDDLRDAMYRCGIHHPWYWRGGIVGGAILEYWHAAVEFVKWKQKKAYRGPVPHWYDGLRGAER